MNLFQCQSCNFHNILYREPFFFHPPGIANDTFLNAFFATFRTTFFAALHTTFFATFHTPFYLSFQLGRIKNIILNH